MTNENKSVYLLHDITFTNTTNLCTRYDLVLNTGIMQLTAIEILIETRYFLPLYYDEIVHIEIQKNGILIEFNN